MDDVGDYTAQWILSGGDTAAFYQGVAPIAEDHGITNWETDEITYKAIGQGLKQADISGDRYQQVKGMLSGDKPDAGEWIDKGYGK
jgi:hypothetical protein